MDDSNLEECECISKCSLFDKKLKKFPSTVNILKEQYCVSNKKLCARYRVFAVLGHEKVPKDLFPNEPGKAIRIISEENNAN